MEEGHGWRKGGKTKKRDSYYRAGCRGRLFSPSSLCGPEDKRLEDWERVRVKPPPTTTDNHTQCILEGSLQLNKVNQQYFAVTFPNNISYWDHHLSPSAHWPLKPLYVSAILVHLIFKVVCKCQCCVICNTSHKQLGLDAVFDKKPRYVGNLLRKCRQQTYTHLVDSYCCSNKQQFLLEYKLFLLLSKAFKENTYRMFNGKTNEQVLLLLQQQC